METKQFKVKAVTPSFWEVTFINPPINLIDAETIQQLNGLLADIEADPKLTVVVFKSDDPDFCYGALRHRQRYCRHGGHAARSERASPVE